MHFGKSLHPASLSRILRQNGFSRQKTRPTHPATDPKAQERKPHRLSRRPQFLREWGHHDEDDIEEIFAGGP